MAYSSALTGGELTALRAGDHTVKSYLSLIPLSSVGTCRINQSSFDVPLAQLTIDNLSGSFTTVVKAGMTAWIGSTSGARDIGVYRVRATPGATTLYIQEMSNGDPGLLASRDLQPLADNAYVTIYEGENAWSVASRIEYSGGVDARVGTFYKDYNIPYVDQNETGGDVPCILNIGNHRTGFVDTTTGLLTTSWTADTYIWDGATVSTYLWNVDGGTITVGNTGTQSITVTHGYGNYLIECTITLSTGAVIVARRWVIASEPTNNPPIEIQVNSDRRDIYGRRMSIRTFDNLSPIIQGQLAIYWEVALWNGSDVASATTSFVGFVKSYSGQNEPNKNSQAVELVSALELLKSTAAFGQQLVVAANPATWTEVSAALSHLDFFLMYLLYWHTTMLRLFDYEPVLLQSYTTQAWKVDGGNLYQQLQNAGTRLNVTVGQASNGTIFARRDPNMMSQTARDLKILRMTMTEADVKRVSPSYEVRNQVGKVHGSGFYYDNGSLTPLLAVFPGNVGGQGSDSTRLEGQLVTLAGGQDELGQRCANEFARLNNPYPNMSIFIPYNLDVFEPAEKYWVGLAVSASYWHNSDGVNLRGLVSGVTINHLGGGKKTVNLDYIPETAGVDVDAETVPVQLPSTGNAPYLEGNSYTLLPTTPYDLTSGLLTFSPSALEIPPYTVAPPLLSPLETGTGILIVGQAGTVKITTGVSAGTPTFTTVHNPGSGKNFKSFVYDGSDTYVLYDDGTSSYLYLIETITGTPSASLKQTFSSLVAGNLRKPAGVADGISALVYDAVNSSTQGFGTYPDAAYTIVSGTHSASGGNPGGNVYDNQLVVNPFTATVTVEFDTTDWGAIDTVGYDMRTESTDTGDRSHFQRIRGWDGSSWTILYDNNSSPETLPEETWYTRSRSVTPAVWEKIEIRIYAGWIDGTKSGVVRLDNVIISGYGHVYIKYSANTGIAISTVDVGGYFDDEAAYDIDDFNLGVHIAAASKSVFYTDSYTQATADELTGLAGIDGVDIVTCIRIPYKKLATQALNNDVTSLQFIYCTDAGYTAGVTFNANTGAIAAESDMSIIISGTTYYVLGANALETYGDNTQTIFATVKPVGGGDTKLVRSIDGGGSWDIRNTVDAYHVHIQEPLLGGNGSRLYVSGDVGNKYSPSGGTGLLSKSATATIASWYLGT